MIACRSHVTGVISAGIVGSSIGMPDIHSGYGFAVGNVAAFDMDDPASVVSPGGVGFDINCGVRLIRTGIVNSQAMLCKMHLSMIMFIASFPVFIVRLIFDLRCHSWKYVAGEKAAELSGTQNMQKTQICSLNIR